MATELKSQSEYLDLFIDAVQDEAPDLTDTNEGSKLDTLAGVISFAATEINRITVDKFNKTFIETAHGPEVTGDADDLQTLVVDHFGDSFARPEATYATDTVTFSRPTAVAGICTIAAGSVVKTQQNAQGVAQRFATESEVTLGIGVLTIDATVTALVAGVAGNVEAEEINEIETALTDPTVVVINDDAATGGEEEQDDATYRETIRNLINAAKGATLDAIEAAALNVAGIETATAIESEKVVIEFDIATNLPVVDADYFRIPEVILYVADINGVASGALLTAVEVAIAAVRAAGVRIDVGAATALSLNWTASITLNPGGPNYAELSSDPQEIIETMEQYIRDSEIGEDFVKVDADAAMLAIWGPSGTNDLVTFSTSIPSGNVAVSVTQKLIPGTVVVE